MQNNKKNFYLDFLEVLKSNFPEESIYSLEKSLETLICTNVINDLDTIVQWYEERIKLDKASVNLVSINKLDKWNFNEHDELVHDSDQFFKIVGVQVRNAKSREVQNLGWDQPFISEVNSVGGLLGLIRTKIDELPHYLVEAKFEPGNYNKILLSPTLQATFSNINQAHKGRKPYYYEFFEDYEKTENYLFNNWLTEDGGRLYNKRNLGLVKFIPYEEISLKDGFIFLSMFQIKQLIRESSIVNPHLARLIFL